MDAFLTRLEGSLPEGGRIGQRAFWYAWNTGDPDGVAGAWPGYRALLPTITVLTRAWARARARQTDLAEGLVRFCENRL